MKKPAMIFAGLAGLVVLVGVAVVAIQLLRSDDPNLATEAPLISTPGLDGSPAAALPTETTAGSTGVVLVPEGVRSFTIVPAESEAKYVVRESLRGIETNAVGMTSAIEGTIHLTPEGLAEGVESSFRVDLSALKSDEGMRDNYIKRNTLQTSRYQFAEFVVEEVTGFPAGYVEKTQVELTMSGTLTIRDISKPVTWTVLARQAGDTLTATADLDIRFDDFGMSPPSVPIATAQDEIHIQVVLVAREGV